jgi:hypothetical protein
MATETILFQRGTHGSRERMIRNLYAYRVAAVMAGREAVCPSCERPFYVDNDGEVDRTFPRATYVTGEIVYLCGDCNQSRANVEWANVAAYRAAVRAASESVSVPTAREARDWWQARPRKPHGNRRWA